MVVAVLVGVVAALVALLALRLAALDHLRARADHVQRGAELVGDPGRELAHGGEPIGVPELLERRDPGVRLAGRRRAQLRQMSAHLVQLPGELSQLVLAGQMQGLIELAGADSTDGRHERAEPSVQDPPPCQMDQRGAGEERQRGHHRHAPDGVPQVGVVGGQALAQLQHAGRPARGVDRHAGDELSLPVDLDLPGRRDRVTGGEPADLDVVASAVRLLDRQQRLLRPGALHQRGRRLGEGVPEHRVVSADVVEEHLRLAVNPEGRVDRHHDRDGHPGGEGELGADAPHESASCTGWANASSRAGATCSSARSRRARKRASISPVIS